MLKDLPISLFEKNKYRENNKSKLSMKLLQCAILTSKGDLFRIALRFDLSNRQTPNGT